MTYTISEAAKKSGIGAHAIRFYDRQGLLPFIRRENGGVRRFSELDMECLEIVSMLKATGMTIRDIKKYLDMCVLGDRALEQRMAFVTERKAAIERQIEEYKKYMEIINYKIWYYQTALEAGSETVHDRYYEEHGVSSRERYSKLI